MKEYEFVSIRVDTFTGAKSESHKEIIREYAGKGWRYAGVIPTALMNNGKLKEMDLVFERDV